MAPPTPDNPSAGKPARRLIGRGVIPKVERVVFDRRPSPWMIAFKAAPPLLGLALGFAVIELLLDWAVREQWLWNSAGGPTGSATPGATLWMAAWVLGTLELAWAILDWVCRRYVLTERRAMVVSGVLHQRVAELPLERMQNAGVSKPLLPRLLGLGHVGLASAGTDGYEVVWRYMYRPDRRAKEVRQAADAVREKA